MLVPLPMILSAVALFAPAPQDVVPRIPKHRQERPFALMVGDQAPQLPVAQWLKGQPVPKFENGRVTVVAFWATWSMPAVREFEHLNQIQERYPSSVDVIAVSVWESRPDEVGPYVKRMGNKMAFRVAIDDVPPAPEEFKNKMKWAQERGAVTRAWLTESGKKEDPLPIVFLVDQQGRVAWIGTPDAVDAPLESLVAYHWDMDKEAEDYRQRMVRLIETRPILAQLEAAQQRRDWQTVVGCIEEAMALDPEANMKLAGVKFRTLIVELKQPEKAYAFAQEALTSYARDSIEGLSQIAYVIAFEAKPGPAELELGRTIAMRADELAKSENGFVLDALARIHFLRGDVELAIATENLALGKIQHEAERQAYTKHLQQYEEARGH